MSKFNPFQGLRSGGSVISVEDEAANRYSILDELGEGGFGTVFKVQRKGCEGEEGIFAMKSIPTNNVEDLSRFEAELGISKQLNHPHIVKLYETITSAEEYYLIMDLCTGGDLFEVIVDKGGLDTPTIGRLLWQMLSGIAYLHHYRFVHRDIKPENYMLSEKDSATPNLKLIDFGLARKYDPDSGEVMRSKVGTRNYMAPELFADNRLRVGYTHKCDLWSIGATLFIMAAAVFPWNAKKDDNFVKNQKKKEPDYETSKWSRHPAYLSDTCKKLLIREQDKRPAAKEIVVDADVTKLVSSQGVNAELPAEIKAA